MPDVAGALGQRDPRLAARRRRGTARRPRRSDETTANRVPTPSKVGPEGIGIARPHPQPRAPRLPSRGPSGIPGGCHGEPRRERVRHARSAPQTPTPLPNPVAAARRLVGCTSSATCWPAWSASPGPCPDRVRLGRSSEVGLAAKVNLAPAAGAPPAGAPTSASAPSRAATCASRSAPATEAAGEVARAARRARARRVDRSALEDARRPGRRPTVVAGAAEVVRPDRRRTRWPRSPADRPRP